MFAIKLCVLLIVGSQSANCEDGILEVTSKALDVIKDILKQFPGRAAVLVANDGSHRAMLKCASKNDRIGNPSGEWVDPGQSISWTFTPYWATQFWCTMHTFGKAPKTGWDVYVGKHKPRKSINLWRIKDDGVYNSHNQRIRSYHS